METWALKDAEKLDHKTRERVLAALQRLAETGHGDVTKLKDVSPPEYRLRVGDCRVRYGLDPTPTQTIRSPRRRRIDAPR
jgi:mRNA-degrading endonuclease RelE of RelBE toxin-antitoxin system